MKKIILSFFFAGISVASCFAQDALADPTGANTGTGGFGAGGPAGRSLIFGVPATSTARLVGIQSIYATAQSSNPLYRGMEFYTAASRRLFIASGGNIAIGSYTTPSTRLSFGPHGQGTDQIMKVSVFDNGLRFGMGYFEEPNGGDFNRVFAFYASEGRTRYGFFDNYNGDGLTTASNGYEFVTFKLSNRSVGICNTSPSAKLHVNSMESTNDPFLLNLTTSTGSYMRFGAGYFNPSNFEINAIQPSSNTKGLVLQGDANPGNVGIGVFPSSSTPEYSSPLSKLHIQGGNFQITNSNVAPDISKSGLTMGGIGTKTANTSTDYSWIQASSGPLLLNPKSLNDITASSNTNNFVGIGFERSSLASLGTIPAGYNLLVRGKILCEELKIKLKTGSTWYDYVLKPDYKLMSLDSLELFINQNSHLPDIPSEAEVKENGIMAGEMNGLLLKKVEELTLYMIEQNKNVAVQAEQIELLKKQNELLMQQMQRMVQNNQSK